MKDQVDHWVVVDTVGSDGTPEAEWDPERWVKASRRMARVLDHPAAKGRPDPGASLLQLLDFADAVAKSVGPRKWEPLAFPVLSRMAERAD